MNTTHTIDATGKVLGRLSSEVAKMLMGKNSPDYSPNVAPKVKVTIINASKTKMTEKRKLETLHEKYSGRPGGLKMKTNAKIISHKGFTELYKLAIYNMLPANKLRDGMMKNLTITE
jgi:large subunit ribosomal protein L13